MGPVAGESGAARFDGADDYIDLGPMDVSGNQLTLAGWFKADTFPHAYARLISKATSTNIEDHYWQLGTCRKDSRTRLRFHLRTGGSTTVLEASSGNIATGTWVFAAAVYDGAEMRLYKDGVLVGRTPKSGSVSTNSRVAAWIGDNPPGSIRSRYLRDLERMRAAGDGDYRPLTGPVFLPRQRTGEVYLSLIEDDLNVSVTDIPASNSAPLSHPGSVTGYRLYPGGKQYVVPALPYSLSNASYGPDVMANPLGVFRCPGTLVLNSNVSIQGTILTTGGGDIQVQGNNVTLTPFDLPALDSGGTVQLPVAIVADDIWVYEPDGTSIRGLAVASDDFEIRKGTEDTRFSYEGRIIVQELKLYGRSQWDMYAATWSSLIERFMDQLYDTSDSNHSRYFPRWLGNVSSREPEPQLTIKPDPKSPSYHWQDWSQPVYVPHPNDVGLVWDLLEWTDNP